MKARDISNRLRKLVAECEDESMQLPVEMVAIIHNDKSEASWQWIGVDKVLQYISDMLEE